MTKKKVAVNLAEQLPTKSSKPMHFSNFWCSVSGVRFGPNASDEVVKAVMAALKRFL